MSRQTGYTQAIKRPYHNLIDSIIRQMNYDPRWVGRGSHSQDYILGYEMALRALADANGSFRERLKSLLFPKDE